MPRDFRCLFLSFTYLLEQLLMSIVRVLFAVVSYNKIPFYPSRSVIRWHTLNQFVRHVVNMSQGNYYVYILFAVCLRLTSLCCLHLVVRTMYVNVLRRVQTTTAPR